MMITNHDWTRVQVVIDDQQGVLLIFFASKFYPLKSSFKLTFPLHNVTKQLNKNFWKVVPNNQNPE